MQRLDLGIIGTAAALRRTILLARLRGHERSSVVSTC
jgi:hypothetical protein